MLLTIIVKSEETAALMLKAANRIKFTDCYGNKLTPPDIEPYSEDRVNWAGFKIECYCLYQPSIEALATKRMGEMIGRLFMDADCSVELCVTGPGCWEMKLNR